MQAATLGVDPSLILLHNNCNVAAAGSVSPVAGVCPARRQNVNQRLITEGTMFFKYLIVAQV